MSERTFDGATVREGLPQELIGERIALINQLRGLLAEFGLVLAPGANQVRSKLPALLENANECRRYGVLIALIWRNLLVRHSKHATPYAA
jgi:hypothetical protein